MSALPPQERNPVEFVLNRHPEEKLLYVINSALFADEGIVVETWLDLIKAMVDLASNDDKGFVAISMTGSDLNGPDISARHVSSLVVTDSSSDRLTLQVADERLTEDNLDQYPAVIPTWDQELAMNLPMLINLSKRMNMEHILFIAFENMYYPRPKPVIYRS